jgi:hypothetical protein
MLLQEEMDALTYYVLSGCTKETAFLKFARPDFIGSKSTPAIKSAVTQFYATKEAKEYIEAYRKTIEDLLAEKAKPKPTEESMEARKARSKTKLIEFAMTLADDIENASDPEAILKIADKVGLLDQDEQAEEQPRRYLPESCGSCAYRQFCEDNTEDMCQYCKYKKQGEKSGVHFNKEEMLEFPEK